MQTIDMEQIIDLYRKCKLGISENGTIRNTINQGTLNNTLNVGSMVENNNAVNGLIWSNNTISKDKI